MLSTKQKIDDSKYISRKNKKVLDTILYLV